MIQYGGSNPPSLQTLSEPPTMTRIALPVLFSLLTSWVGLQTLQSASATVNEHQERYAEMVCSINPSKCGQ